MAINAVNRLLEAYYLEIETHIIAASIYEKMGDEKSVTYHLKFAKGLLRSIFQSGDGLGYQTAFTVINIAEEYTILRFLGIQPSSQSLRNHEGHHFDVFEMIDSKSGETKEIYFNIDIPMRRLEHDL